MQKFITKVTQTVLASTVMLAAIAIDTPFAKAVSLIEKDLFFGRNIPGGGQVSEEEFQDFVDDVITKRFPAGLTIVDADGQFLDSTGTLVQEPSKLVTLFLRIHRILRQLLMKLFCHIYRRLIKKVFCKLRMRTN